MSLDLRLDFDAIDAAAIAAEKALTVPQKVRARRARSDGYLDLKHINTPLDHYWRSWSAAFLLPPLYVEKLTDNPLEPPLYRVTLDLSPFAGQARIDREGRDAIRAVLHANADRSGGRPDVEFSVPLMTAIVAEDRLGYVVRSCRRASSRHAVPLCDGPDPTDATIATRCDRCGAGIEGPRYTFRVQRRPIVGASPLLVICQSCSDQLTTWLAEGGMP